MKAEDNEFPKVVLTPVDPATLTVPTGDQALVLDSTDSDTLKLVDDAGTVTPVDSGGGGGGTTDTWHNVAAFANSWVNFGGSEPVAAYMIDGAGNVHLRGTIKSGEVAVLTDGTVGVYTPAGNSYVRLDGITFPIT